MDNINQISDASLYTDFSGLQKLRAKVSNNENNAESIAESRAANKEVAKQFESLFLQMMLKTMREATIAGDSAESDQTRFYQEMFDKQIALDLASNEGGGGLGIAAMLEKDMKGKGMSDTQQANSENAAINNLEFIRKHINQSSGASSSAQNTTGQNTTGQNATVGKQE